MGSRRVGQRDIEVPNRMIELTYTLESLPELAGWEVRRDIATASRGELLWYFFPVDVVLRMDGAEISTVHAGIPLMDFVLSTVEILEKLPSVNNEILRYTFTEAIEDLSFQSRSGLVEIRASFSPLVLRCPLGALRHAVKQGASDAVSEIGSRYPSFLRTSLAAEIVAKSQAL
jgi:hypothetical protein